MHTVTREACGSQQEKPVGTSTREKLVCSQKKIKNKKKVSMTDTEQINICVSLEMN